MPFTDRIAGESVGVCGVRSIVFEIEDRDGIPIDRDRHRAITERASMKGEVLFVRRHCK